MNIKHWFRGRLRILAGALLLTLSAAAQQPEANVRQFPLGSLRGTGELPPGRLRTQLEQLPIEARERALGWLRSFHFSEHDLETLHADANGGIYYADPLPDGAAGLAEAPLPETAGAAVPVSPFPAGLIFHSRPGAPNVVFLNFSGESVSNTEWNTSLGRTTIPAVAFSIDADRTTFSDAEQLAIRRIWQRVSEDYAPFNIDVTTERPATFTTRTAHALITRSSDANSQSNPSAGSGGVAYVNVFGSSGYARYRPAWIYHDNLANEESYVAEAVSHEVGHNLGLSHDGTTSGSAYYAGHGSGEISWGTIMGNSYDRSMTQWSKGEYYQSNNQQDDLATIAGKLSYRTDDHGNTPGTASALVLTGTNIVATTPATDPTNFNPANKGVIERNTDVDVFSFVTGTGKISLTASPWIVPSGRTRGGNLDVRLELYDEAGTLLQAGDPAAQTAGQITTNLTEGRYYVQVRNTGTGDPLATTPSGYTSYASLGQYFITGYVAPDSGFVAPPGAELQVAGISQPGQGPQPLRVTYYDDRGIRVSTIDGNDVRVTGPNGYDRPARFVSVDAGTDGTPRIATYAADPPNGAAWLAADNGSYTVQMQSGQVSDVDDAWVAGGLLGQFVVALPTAVYVANMDVNPGWTLEPEWEFGPPAYPGDGPTGGFTGANIIGYNLNGNYANRLAAKYAATPPINTAGTSSLTLRFRRWLRVLNNDIATVEVSTNGTAWTPLWTSSRRVADAAWQEVQYPLPAGFAGSPSLRLRWGLSSNAAQNDIGWNLDDVELFGDGAVDAQPPVASLSVAGLTIGGSPSQSCSVTYWDGSAVRLATLDATDLLVIAPDGTTNTVEFVGADLPADGSPITAAYSIPGPGGIWDSADNGVYQLVLVEGEVADIFNNAAPQTALGSFTVDIPESQQALVVTPVALTVPEGGEASFTVRLAEAPASNVTVTTLRVSGDPAVTVQSGDTLTFTGANWSVPVQVTLHAAGDVERVDGSAVFECRADFLQPVTVLVTKEDRPPGELGVTPAGGLVAFGLTGGPFTPGQVTYALTNSGGIPLDWLVTRNVDWVSLSAQTGTLAPGEATNVSVSFNAATATLLAGDFTGTVGFTNLTFGLGNTTRPVSVSVRQQSLVVTPLDLTVLEGGEASFTVRLAEPPISTVTVTTLRGSGDLTINVQSGGVIEFTPDNWSTPVPIVLHADPDADSEASVAVFECRSEGLLTVKVLVTKEDVASGQLAVTPAGGLVAEGLTGGPFTPNQATYALTNSGGSNLDWLVTKTAAWLSLSAETGTLAPGEGTNVTVSFNATANTLTAGTFNDVLGFTNLTSGIGNTMRAVSLTLRQQALVVSSTAVTVPEGGDASLTVRLAEAPASTVTVTTLRVGGDSSVVVQDGASLEFTSANWSKPVPVTLHAEPDADFENSSAVFEVRADGLAAVTVQVTKADSAPGVLEITPSEGLLASGLSGGPFLPTQRTYALTNSGGSGLDWLVAKNVDWLSLSATSGMLAPGEGTNVTVSFNAAANALPAGTFNDAVGFTNLTSGIGNTTRAVSLTITPLPTVNLTVTVNEPAWGSVSRSGGSYSAGTALQLLATPATYFQFREWRGGVASTENPLPLTLTADRAVEAVFAEIYTTNHPTPHWWLASYGYTGDFEAAVLQVRANGLPLWQSYVAGLNPNDPTSQFRVTGQFTPDGTAYVLNWSTVSNRVYSLWTGSLSLNNLVPLPGAVDLPWTVHSFTNTVDNGAPAKFYQLRVEKP